VIKVSLPSTYRKRNRQKKNGRSTSDVIKRSSDYVTWKYQKVLAIYKLSLPKKKTNEKRVTLVTACNSIQCKDLPSKARIPSVFKYKFSSSRHNILQLHEWKSFFKRWHQFKSSLSAVYRTWRIIIVLAKARYYALVWASLIHRTPSHYN
jgi:hypothetical protein